MGCCGEKPVRQVGLASGQMLVRSEYWLLFRGGVPAGGWQVDGVVAESAFSLLDKLVASGLDEAEAQDKIHRGLRDRGVRLDRDPEKKIGKSRMEELGPHLWGILYWSTRNHEIFVNSVYHVESILGDRSGVGCEECAEECRGYVKEFGIGEDWDDEQRFRWVHELHQRVNRKLRKPVVSFDKAWSGFVSKVG